jgi:hypothetical protein
MGRVMAARTIRRADAAMNAVWVAVGLGIAAASWATGVWDASGPGGGFLGLIAGLVIALGGAFLLAAEAGEERAFTIDPAALRRILAVVGGLCLMTLLMPMLGFILAAIVTLLPLLRLIERQSWAAILAFSLISTLVIYWVFDRLLSSTLPHGPFGF